MAKLIVLRGFPGSGKSTLANEILRKDGNAIRVNRDDLRNMLFRDRKWSPASEDIVGMFEANIIQDAIAYGKTIIVDNTHLKPLTIERFKQNAEKYGAKFEHIDLTKTVSLAECIERDSKREGKARVGRGVIDRMALSNKLLDFSTLDKVAVVDIDGTLSDLNHRLHFIQGESKNYDAFFDWVDMDGVYETIFAAVHRLKSWGYTVIVLSGRSNSCGWKTNEWLNGRCYPTEREGLGFNPDYLFMRQSGDHRPDDQVKRQLMNWMFDCGLRKDAIKVVLDDRDSVCAVWREMGLPLIQVSEGQAIDVAPSAEAIYAQLGIQFNAFKPVSGATRVQDTN